MLQKLRDKFNSMSRGTRTRLFIYAAIIDSAILIGLTILILKLI